MASVELQAVSKVFANGGYGVRDLSLHVADGEILAMVGPSGAGKTTALRLIAGLDEPTSGEIRIGGRSMKGVSPADREVAMVFQTPALYPHWSVRKNLAFPLRQRRLASHDVERKIAAAAKTWSIEPFLDRWPAELSGGERSRVAIAKAVVREPQVLLLDEPLASLDAPLRNELRQELSKLPATLGIAVIYVTHDQTEAMAIGERLCVLHLGTIQQLDTPQNVYARPESEFVGRFIGGAGMNLIPGTLSQKVFTSRAADEKNELRVAIRIDLHRTINEVVAQENLSAMLGVRPHDLSTDNSGVLFAEVKVDRIERLGQELAVYFTCAGERQSARLPSGIEIQAGSKIRLWLHPGAVHLFSQSDGRRLN